jgi:hypothetical protein
MVDKAQKLAQKARKKEEKRRKERAREKKRQVKSTQNRLEVRIAKQSTIAWLGEPPEDRAVFDDAAFEALQGEVAEHVACVRQALAEVCQRAPGQAVEGLVAISRRSPMAEWRLLLRGLLSWQAGELAEASEAWSRLDRQRRPWRIAASLVLAHHDDLTDLRHGGSGTANESVESVAASSDVDPWVANCDDQLLVHAKLVRQSQIQRVALRNAGGIAKIKTDVTDATICPDHINWMRDFTKQHQSIDPELVQSLNEAIVMRAFCGPYIDIFEQCAKSFRGPRHDRSNTLSKFFYYREGDNEQKAHQHLSHYLKIELPRNAEVSDSLRGAIISQIYCNLAAAELSPPDTKNMFSMFFDGGPDEDLVEEYFNKAIDAYPANRSAYEGFQAWYRQLLADDDLLKDSRRAIESELASVLSRRLQNLPDDIDVRLELVDYLLENDRSEEAQGHIEWLSGTRRDNPLADAMLWKWNLQEAMRYGRRKAWLSLASSHLDTAQTIWPQWLSSDWLPYLRAAVLLRGGDKDAFDTMPSDQRVASEVAEACMKLGAAQRMSVPAANLKTLRNEVDDHLVNIKGIAAEDLMSLATFFWGLHRSRFKYPAYRMHARKFLDQLRKMFDRSPKMVTEHLDEPAVRSTLLIMANEGCFHEPYNLTLPKWLLSGDRRQHPTVLATVVTAVIGMRQPWGADEYWRDGEALRKASQSMSDPFYRHLYNDLADRLENKIREQRSGMRQILRNMRDAEDDDEDDDDTCDCPDCRRRRGEIT